MRYFGSFAFSAYSASRGDISSGCSAFTASSICSASLGLAFVVLHLGASHFGSAVGLSLALATCVFWNLMLWQIGRMRAAR